MDVWEGNNVAAAFTAHPCSPVEQTRCEDATCGSLKDRYVTACDPDGCDFNSYRMGNTTFYGPGKTIDSLKPFTVVTQFITDDGSSTGNLKEIRRLYIQNGQVIQNSKVNVPGMDPSMSSLTDDFCDVQKSVFGDTRQFQAKGGLSSIGAGMKEGMALVFALWDDHNFNMLWLDSTFPIDADPTAPGISRGTCSYNNGYHLYPELEVIGSQAYVTYSNIKFGEIGSTYGPGSATPTSSGSPTSTSGAPSAATQTKYGQCGGQGWTGPTQCASGSTCTTSNPFYSQCL